MKNYCLPLWHPQESTVHDKQLMSYRRGRSQSIAVEQAMTNERVCVFPQSLVSSLKSVKKLSAFCHRPLPLPHPLFANWNEHKHTQPWKLHQILKLWLPKIFVDLQRDGQSCWFQMDSVCSGPGEGNAGQSVHHPDPNWNTFQQLFDYLTLNYVKTSMILRGWITGDICVLPKMKSKNFYLVP